MFFDARQVVDLSGFSLLLRLDHLRWSDEHISEVGHLVPDIAINASFS